LRIELQRLISFSGFCIKKVPAVAGAFFAFLLGFLVGVLGKRVFFRWFFVANLWSLGGNSRSFDGHSFADEKYASF
jgi:hypothetical protein